MTEGYKWLPRFRFTPLNGSPEELVVATAFSDLGGQQRTVLDYVPDQDVRTDINRGRSILFHGFRPTIRLEFEVFTTADQSHFATIVNRMRSTDWLTELSLDDGGIYRAVYLERLDGPNPIAGKTWIGAEWTITMAAVQLLPEYPDMNAAHPDSKEFIANGGFELWNSATDAASWSENVGGANTINEESTIVHSGLRSSRLDYNEAGLDLAHVFSITGLKPGSLYRLAFWARASASDPDGCTMLLRNLTRAKDLRPDGTWASGWLFNDPVDATWRLFESTFTVDETFAVADIYDFTIIGYYMPIGQSLYLDDASLFGPLRPPGVYAW